jgi:hypothetical protein
LPELSVAAEIVVRDSESYMMAGETWKSLTALEKKIKAYWEEDVSTALKLHRSLVAKRDAMLMSRGRTKEHAPPWHEDFRGRTRTNPAR